MKTNVARKFKQTLIEALGYTGLTFYTKPQKYHVHYQVRLINTSSKQQNFYLVLPLPSDQKWQKILSEVTLYPDNYRIKLDKKFGNKYVFWRVSLKANERKDFGERFAIKVSPLQHFKEKIDPVFLESNKYLNTSNPRLAKLVSDLAGSETNPLKLVKVFNSYTVKNLNYGKPFTGLYSLSEVFEKNQIDCGGFNVLLGSLSLAKGISTILVSGFWAGSENNNMHSWLLLGLPDGSILPADPSIEHLIWKNRTHKSGRLGFIGSDRIVMSLGCNIPLEIGGKEKVVDILQNPILLGSEVGNIIVESKFLTEKL